MPLHMSRPPAWPPIDDAPHCPPAPLTVPPAAPRNHACFPPVGHVELLQAVIQHLEEGLKGARKRAEEAAVLGRVRHGLGGGLHTHTSQMGSKPMSGELHARRGWRCGRLSGSLGSGLQKVQSTTSPPGPPTQFRLDGH